MQFKFPGGEAKSQAKLLGTINHALTDFTICHWSKTNKPVSGPAWEYIFRYTVLEKAFTILTAWQHNKLVHVYGDSKVAQADISLPSNEWVHLCFIWSVTDTTSEMYINGQLASHQTSLTAASPIQPNGVVVVGEHLTGQISELNLWDYALTTDEIKQIYNCEDQVDGNVISWYNSVWELLEGATVSHVRLPCGGRK